MKTINAIFILGLALSLSRSARAGSAGAEPFNFLFLDANARAVALSGAYGALAADANALLYNPAGLGNINHHQATFMHNQYFQEITQEYLAYASPEGWGVSFNRLGFGDIRNTTISNKTGAGLGSVGVTDMAIGAGYGRALSDNISVGAGIKFIRESIGDISGQGVGLDAGVLYSLPAFKGLSLAAAVQNIGPAVKFQSSKEKMPLAMRIGAACVFNAAGQASVVSADLIKERSEDMLAALGVETIVAKSFPVRLGYNTRNDAGPGITAGLGYLYNDLSFDYAFVPFKDLGPTHRFSVTLLWGQKKSQLPQEPLKVEEPTPAPAVEPVPVPSVEPSSAPVLTPAIAPVPVSSAEPAKVPFLAPAGAPVPVPPAEPARVPFLAPTNAPVPVPPAEPANAPVPAPAGGQVKAAAGN